MCDFLETVRMFYENGQSQELFLKLTLVYNTSKNRIQVIRFGGQVSQKTFQTITMVVSRRRTNKDKASIALTKN